MPQGSSVTSTSCERAWSAPGAVLLLGVSGLGHCLSFMLRVLFLVSLCVVAVVSDSL